MELGAARKILAEVLGVKLSEVDEMIENRSMAGDKILRENGLMATGALGGGMRMRPASIRARLRLPLTS